MTQPAYPLRGVFAPLVVVLVLGMGPPVGAEVTTSVRESLLLRVGERSLQVQVEPGVISGGDLHLRRVQEGLSGTLKGQPVELKWSEEGDITGRAAGESVELTAVPRSPQPGLTVQGWFGGDTAELTLTPTAISGSVGGCSYSLPMAGNHYSGWRTCDVIRGPPVPVTLRIPENLVPLGVAEEGALLSLLLSAEALPPASSAEGTPGLDGSGTPTP